VAAVLDLLAGDDDPIVPLVNARIMARCLPNAGLEVYPDGHLGLLTARRSTPARSGDSCRIDRSARRPATNVRPRSLG
jgi:hypothetical protein